MLSAQLVAGPWRAVQEWRTEGPWGAVEGRRRAAWARLRRRLGLAGALEARVPQAALAAPWRKAALGVPGPKEGPGPAVGPEPPA